MRDPIELLSALYEMYTDGLLAAEFDKKKNKMVNSADLEHLMSEVEQIIPAKLKPKEAAAAMRALDDEARDQAIKESKDKVIDMRRHFREKMSKNGGALGLTKRLVEALEKNDLMTVGLITMDMQELVKLDEQVPEQV